MSMLGNLFIYPARGSSLVPAGFLTAHFQQKKSNLRSLCCDERTKVFFSALIACRKGEVDTSLFYII